MHSSRMRTARSSSCHGGGLHPPPRARTPLQQVPPRAGNPPQSRQPPQSRHPPEQPAPRQISLNFSLDSGPGPDPPQFPPWLWAWTRSPSTSPLGVGLETPPRPAARHAGIPPAIDAGIAPPPLLTE